MITEHNIFLLQKLTYVGWNDTLVSGWGTTSSGGSLATTLRYVKVHPVADDTCFAAFTAYNQQTGQTLLPDAPTMVCAGTL